MAENEFAAIDERLVRAKDSRSVRARRRRWAPGLEPDPEPAAEEFDATGVEETGHAAHRLPWLEIFLVVQFLWGAILFIPGTQQIRSIVRALPYLTSLGMLAIYLPRRVTRAYGASAALLVAALALLVANLLHPTTQLRAGIAQCIFQLSIAAPVFWASKAVRSPQKLERALLFVFAMNLASAGLGVLQVYFPAYFMPSQLNQNLAQDYLSMLSYVGSDGRVIVRPPGLTDTPGGAASAGALTALIGLGLTLQKRKPWQTAALLGAVAMGLAAIYLTQVRSLLLMTLGAVVVLGAIAFHAGRIAQGSWVLATGGVITFASFIWATSMGGSVVTSRFLSIANTGTIRTYQQERGGFLTYTVTELLDQFPLGAGVGRWGMMNAYFGGNDNFRSPPVHVEIQLTGWLLDGGWPMWIFYGGAIAASLVAGLRLASSPEAHLSELAAVAVTVEILITGMAMAGPAFNTQLGILFWALTAGLYGAAAGERRDLPAGDR